MDVFLVVPAWVGPIVAFLAFLLLRFLIPLFLPIDDGSPLTVFGELSRKLAPLSGLAVLVFWIVAEIQKFGRRRLLDSRTGVGSLRDMSWQEFEQLVGEGYRREGFTVEETGGSADGGVDLILRKDGEAAFVQCKQWKTYKVGVKTVRELFGVMAAEKAERGVVVTCGEFTKAAGAFAEGKPLTLINGPALCRLIESVKKDRSEPEAAKVVAETPTCPTCGAPMVLRTARRGPHAGSKFFGCSRYPKCKGIRDARSSVAK